MTTYQEALSRVLETVSPLEAVETPLAKCRGLVAAEDIYSDYDLPMLDISGPDGYAVRSQDIAGAGRDNPVVLRITGTVRAGRLPRVSVRPGTAVRIMTGSPVPAGADCVVPFESTDEPGNKSGPNPEKPSHVRIFRAEKPGANIRPAGSNVGKGQLVLPQGSSIGPAQISALAAIGKTWVKVIRRPVVGVISTGDELVQLGSPLRPGKCYDCNTPALAALVTHYGALPRVIGIARDNKDSLAGKLRQARGVDAIVTSGGVSKGDYDLVRLVLDEMGKVIVSRLNMGPGASFAFGVVYEAADEGRADDGRTAGDGRWAGRGGWLGDRGKVDGRGEVDDQGWASDQGWADDQGWAGDDGARSKRLVPVFALAGPPVGCLINLETLVRPALLKMMGFRGLNHPTVEAMAEEAVVGKKPMDFVKWTRLVDDEGCRRVVMDPAGGGGPLLALARADSLTIIPEGTEVAKGDKVHVLPLGWTRE